MLNPWHINACFCLASMLFYISVFPVDSWRVVCLLVVTPFSFQSCSCLVTLLFQSRYSLVTVLFLSRYSLVTVSFLSRYSLVTVSLQSRYSLVTVPYSLVTVSFLARYTLVPVSLKSLTVSLQSHSCLVTDLLHCCSCFVTLSFLSHYSLVPGTHPSYIHVNTEKSINLQNKKCNWNRIWFKICCFFK